jgi:hypothetical protein
MGDDDDGVTGVAARGSEGVMPLDLPRQHVMLILLESCCGFFSRLISMCMLDKILHLSPQPATKNGRDGANLDHGLRRLKYGDVLSPEVMRP